MRSQPVRRNRAQVSVIGIGTGGINALNKMVRRGVRGVEFIAIDTDESALENSLATVTIPIGDGNGGGGDPSNVLAHAARYVPTIEKMVQHTDLAFIVSCLGKGTGTALAPLVAEACRKQNALVMGIVTLPFAFEGKIRARIARRGSERLQRHVDTLVAIPNDRLVSLSDADLNLVEAFAHVDDLLVDMVGGVASMLARPGIVNLDFADMRTVMSSAGPCLITHGKAEGTDRARQAAEAVLRSDVLGITIDGAGAILYEIVAGPDVGVREVQEIGDIIRQHADPGANIMFGYTTDETLQGTVAITLVASGFADIREQQAFQELVTRATGRHLSGPELAQERAGRIHQRRSARLGRQILRAYPTPAFLS